MRRCDPPWNSLLALLGNEDICIIDGDRTLSIGRPKTFEGVLNTIEYEIGHLIIMDGHLEGAGAASLPGKTHSLRLMASGTKRSPNGDLMVKGEWDAAEIWLKSRENDN